MNDPYGQGFGAQPGIPPILTSQLGHPWAPGAPPNAPEPPSSSAPAKTAAVLSGLGGVVVCGFAMFGVAETLLNRRYELDLGFVIGSMVVCAYGLLLLGGALMLFKRKRAGRRMVLAGSVLATIIAAIGIAATFTDATRDGPYLPFAVWILVLILTLATFVLAILPSTGRWIRSNPRLVAPQGYPPHYRA